MDWRRADTVAGVLTNCAAPIPPEGAPGCAVGLTREQLRVGVAGCGAIARQVHLPLLQRRRDVKVVAVADSDEDAVAEAARRSGGAQAYRSTEEMLSEAELDAVVVAVPPALHSVAARAVFEAGLHVYLEKPMAPALDDAVHHARMATQRPRR